MRTMTSLGDYSLKESFAKARLTALKAAEVGPALNDICQRAELAEPDGQAVLTAFVPFLINVKNLPPVTRLREAAHAGDLLALMRLLRASTPDGHLIDKPRMDPGPLAIQRPDGKPVSLGERRALARRPSRATIERLLRDPHPMVTHIILHNPRITENDVVKMAAYRPAVPEVVAEIGMSWLRSGRARMTIISNPYSPPAVSIPLLSLLTRPELKTIGRAADLPKVVRATAHKLFALRPPMPKLARPDREH